MKQEPASVTGGALNLQSAKTFPGSVPSYQYPRFLLVPSRNYGDSALNSRPWRARYP